MCREAGETGKAEMKSCIDESSSRLTGIWKLKRLAGGNVELKLFTWNYPLKVEKTNVYVHQLIHFKTEGETTQR